MLIGDTNIDLTAHNKPTLKVLKDLCKQFQLTIHEPIEGTRRPAKLDYLITGIGIKAALKSHIHTDSISDHDILAWNIMFYATKKDRAVFILNRKLVKEITENSVLDTRATDACSLLERFLWRRKLKDKKA